MLIFHFCASELKPSLSTRPNNILLLSSGETVHPLWLELSSPKPWHSPAEKFDCLAAVLTPINAEKSLRKWMENAKLLCFLNPLILFWGLKWWIGFSPGVCKAVNFTVGELKSHQEQNRLGLFYCRSVPFIELIPPWNGQGNAWFLKLVWKCCLIQPYSQNFWCWHTKKVLTKVPQVSGRTDSFVNWTACKIRVWITVSVSVVTKTNRWVLWTDKAVRKLSFHCLFVFGIAQWVWEVPWNSLSTHVAVECDEGKL